MPIVWGVTCARNEADIVEANLRHHLGLGLAGIVLLDNMSDDGTGEIAGSVPGVRVFGDPSPYDHVSQNRRMAELAMGFGAEWVLAIDADEFWYPTRSDDIPRAVASAARGGLEAFRVPGHSHVCSAWDDPSQADPVRRLRWRSTVQSRNPKVAFRCAPGRWAVQGNERCSDGAAHPVAQGAGVRPGRVRAALPPEVRARAEKTEQGAVAVGGGPVGARAKAGRPEEGARQADEVRAARAAAGPQETRQEGEAEDDQGAAPAEAPAQEGRMNILLSVNCFNRFHGGAYFPRWWEHIESQVVRPYRDMLDVALYDDGSTDEGMVGYLVGLKEAGRVDWLTLGPRRGPRLPLARHSFGNAGYAYSLSGWPEHELVLHFDTDVWFVSPGEDRGFDWLGACADKLRGDPRAFAASLWGCLWSNGPSYRDGKPPSWFHLRWGDPMWVESDFFSTRMFLARARELEPCNLAALTEVGRRGAARRRRLVGRIDSYERLAHKNEIRGRRHVVILRPESGVVARHLHGPQELAWAEGQLGIRSVASVDRSLCEVPAERAEEPQAEETSPDVASRRGRKHRPKMTRAQRRIRRKASALGGRR